MTRVLLAVDSEMLRPRLQTILSETAGVDTVHDVSNLQQVMKEVRDFKPHVVVLSLLKLNQSSIRLASTLRAENPKLSLIALVGPFTSRDDAAWQEVGFDCVFNITLGPKLLIDYISTFVVGESHHLKVNALYESSPGKTTQSQSK